MINSRRRQGAVIAALLISAIIVLMVTPFIGMQKISPAEILGGSLSNTASIIFWRIRVPRVLLGFLCGAALAVSGMAFQAMFRNPLATPFTLGVSSGASLGAAICMRLGLAVSVIGIPGVSVFAFLGAMGSISLVYCLTRARSGFSTATMLLAGIAVSLFCSSLILLLQYLSDFTQSFRILRWLMGGLGTVGFGTVVGLVPFVLAGMAVLVYLLNELNLLMTGDDIAISRGVNVSRVKKILFLATSLMVGGVVAACGPIGFVGMMAPHICRLMVGPNHRILMLASVLFGGAFLSLCDTLARTIIAPAEIPVGVITALLGGPFFVLLLLSKAFGRGRLFAE